MQKRYFKFILFFCMAVGLKFEAYASHIAGGEVSYTCNNDSYTIRLDIYQDCLTGEGGAISEDTPAYIGVFNLDNGAGDVFSNVFPTSTLRVPANFDNDCVTNPPTTCLNKLSFFLNVKLPPSNAGYRIVYVRCCRNGSTTNIMNPSATGATYYVDIPPYQVAQCNSSAVFKNYPPQIICVNNPLFYDHSASDPIDGDSLSYEFCSAYRGGSLDFPKPNPTAAAPAPLQYRPGYSAARPMSGSPLIRIDPKTGMISGTPNLQGRFVVTVCCHEWRNGVKINTVSREFQFVVTSCSKAVVANIPQYSEQFNTYIVECSSNTVKFINQSTGANQNAAGPAYFWEFGVPGATSTEFEPSYTYPDTGVYVVKLIVNKGSTCPDSISRFVKIFPNFKADFDFSGLPCPNTPLQFNDRSTTTFGVVNSWDWNFGDNTTGSGAQVSHSFANGGGYRVSLASANEKGCTDTIAKEVFIDAFSPFAGNDTIIVKGEYINFNATGGSEYLWTPSDALSFPNGPTPRGYFPDTGVYAYNVHIKSPLGCEGDDSIEVLVVEDASLFVPSAFTPNGDGLNDLLKPLGVGYANVRFFRVFNRWGEMVFDTNNFAEGWDGTYKGQLCEIGAYYWVLGVKNRFGQDELIKGDATLIR